MRPRFPAAIPGLRASDCGGDDGPRLLPRKDMDYHPLSMRVDTPRGWLAPSVVFILRLLGLTLACAGAARLGMVLAVAHGVSSPLWISAGLAMGPFALWGARLWPALLVGALWANIDGGISVGLAFGLAVGNTLGALLGAHLLKRWSVLGTLKNPADAVFFMAGAASMSLLAAIIGGLCFTFTGQSPWRGFPFTCAARWLGHFVGAILVVPLFLAWFGPPEKGNPKARKGELPLLLGAVAATTAIAFGSDTLWAWLGMGHVSPTLFVIPALVWAALRLPSRFALLALLTMAGVAVGFTANGYGPFTHDPLVDDLLELQLMLSAVGGTLLIVIAAVAEREHVAAELAAAKRAADEANLAKSRFVAAIRHDMVQPLQAAELFLTVLRREIPESKGRKLIDPAVGSLRAMAAGLSALNDITAVECGLVHPQVTTFPLSELLGQLADEVRIQAGERGLGFRAVTGRFTVTTDRQLLGRILRNLLSNALRYTKEGGVLLGCRVDRHGVRIEVWDTGPGIPPEEQETIFQAFRRGSAATHGLVSDSDSGLGLGLATVRQLAFLLDLGVSVRSVVGKGSVFSVLVPIAPARQGKRTAA